MKGEERRPRAGRGAPLGLASRASIVGDEADVELVELAHGFVAVYVLGAPRAPAVPMATPERSAPKRPRRARRSYWDGAA